MFTKLKYLLLLLLTGFGAKAQVSTTLFENGDSSIYLVGVNDTLSYLSFADPDNIMQLFMDRGDASPFSNNESPMSSCLLLARYVKNDTLFLREIFSKRYLNPSLTYSVEQGYPRDELHILFEGKDLPGDGFLNMFDSLYVQIGDSSYLGDLNTSIYRFTTPKRTGRFTIRVYDSQGKVDYTIPVCVKRNRNGLFIRFDQIASSLASFTYQDYLKKNIPARLKTKDADYVVNIQFVDWFHYWETKEIRYYSAKPRML